MSWTKNLSNILLPRSGQRGNVRQWQTLADRANRDSSRRDDGPDYTEALDDVRLSAVVMACVGWVATMLPRCPWTLERRVDDAWEPLEAHPVLDLLASPTPWHGGPEMLAALVCDYLIDGTAYWQRVAPSRTGPPHELWWRPSSSLTPTLNAARTGLEGFTYTVDEKTSLWASEDVVQVRNVQHGQNPANPWLGVRPMAALAPEAWIDKEATRMTAALLGNLGQLGITLIAKETKDGEAIQEGDAQALKKYLKENFSGSKRGGALFVEFPADIHGGGLIDPDLMHPKAIRDYVQEMTCAVFRLPAAVVQFGVGLDAATQNATMVQLERQAWETGVLPVQGALASQIGRQLLPAFGLDVASHRLGFDTSEVEVLQKNRKDEAAMWGQLVKDGIVLRSTALEALDLPFDDSDEVRHMPIGVIEVPAGMTMLEAEEERTPEPEPEPTPEPVMVVKDPDEDEDEEDDGDQP